MANEKDPLLLPVTVNDHGSTPNVDDNDEESNKDAASDHHHHHNHGMMATIVEGAADKLHEVQENVMDEIHDVQDAFAEETENENESSYFLEMGMARAWSILPSDLPDVAEAVDHMLGAPDNKAPATSASTTHTEATSLSGGAPPDKPKAPLHAYLMLALAVVALSSIGPMLDLQQGCSPTMKIYWRMSGTAMFLFPLCCVDIYKQGLPVLTLPQITTFCLAAACYATMTNGFVLALDYTTVGNAVILANCQAILFLIGRLFVGEPISMLEGIGASMAFLGAVLCSRDGSSEDDNIGGGGFSMLVGIYGDLLALIAGIGGAWYLIFAKAARSHLTLYTFMFLVMAVGSTFTLLFQMVILEETVTFDRNVLHGTWGWMNFQTDRLPLELSMVVICNLLGSVGYIRSMQYFDPLVVSTAGLMEPVIATFMVFALGIGSLPGWMGWMGNVFVAAGTLAVIYPTDDHKHKKDPAH